MTNSLETQVGAITTAMSAAHGDACDYGCTPEAVEHWKEYVRHLNSGKRLVAVSNWCWWDLQFPGHPRDKVDDILRLQDILPVYLYANNVLFDSSGGFRPGDWVRSTALKKLHEHCLFETRNSLYLMVGPGSRQQVDIAIAHLLL